MPPEQGDPVLADLGAKLGVVDAQPLGRGQAQHTDLALVQVVVHLVRGLATCSSGKTADRRGWILPSQISWLASHASR